jgi:hypothetical protein
MVTVDNVIISSNFLSSLSQSFRLKADSSQQGASSSRIQPYAAQSISQPRDAEKTTVT